MLASACRCLDNPCSSVRAPKTLSSNATHADDNAGDGDDDDDSDHDDDDDDDEVDDADDDDDDDDDDDAAHDADDSR